MALSLLHTMASQYQNPGNPAPTAAPSAGGNGAPPSAPVNIPGALPNSPPPASGLGVSPNNNSNSLSGMCIHCHQRLKHYDGIKMHSYCSKSCANQAKVSTTNGSSTSGTCDYCNKRPKFFDGVQTHPYCSKACAAGSGKTAPRKQNTTNGNSKGTCLVSGCQKPCYTNANGTIGDYCSQAHKTLGETICLMCRKVPKAPNSHFCGQTCSDDAEKNGPMLLEIPIGHVTFKSVADQFKTSWRHLGKTCPPVRRVYKILAPQASLSSYNAYRAAVEARGQFVSQGRSAGNENRRWHGTRRECSLGDKGNTTFCGSSTCSLCCIVKTSYDLSLWGKKTGWGRFGKGIYTSSTSSKSHDYSQNDCKSSLKAMLLNKVVVGKGCKMIQDFTTLTGPPPGYDSVLAEKGGTLNYDELVVYRNDAIRPSYLVMYEL